jgi:predicted DNA-binding protein (UPF0251 family)
MHDMTPDQAVAYAASIAEMNEYRRITADRDAIIRRADAAQVAKAAIARQMDISRDTVIRVLGNDSEEG